MARPKHSRRLSILEGQWYSAKELMEEGFTGWCCDKALASLLCGFDKTGPNSLEEWGVTVGERSGWERWPWTERQSLAAYTLFKFKSRRKAKALREDLRILDIKVRLSTPKEQYMWPYLNCRCKEPPRRW